MKTLFPGPGKSVFFGDRTYRNNSARAVMCENVADMEPQRPRDRERSALSGAEAEVG